MSRFFRCTRLNQFIFSLPSTLYLSNTKELLCTQLVHYFSTISPLISGDIVFKGYLNCFYITAIIGRM